VITGRATAAALVSGDLLIFGRGSDLMAARFDSSQGVMAGAPVTISRELRVAADLTPLFATSGQGMLVEVLGRSPAPQLELVRGSTSQPLTDAHSRMSEIALDQTGQRLAGIISDGLRPDLWIGDVVRRTMTRLTNTHPAAAPVWSRDGRQIVFSAIEGGSFNLWSADPASPSATRVLTSTMHQFASDVTSAGEIVFTQVDPATRGDIWIRRSDGQLAALVKTAFDERDGAVSPDRRWLAYLSDQSGRWQVYLKSLGGDAQTVISDGGAGRPRWLDDGRLAFTIGSHRVIELQVTPEGPMPSGPPRTLADGAVVSIAPSGALLVARNPPPPGSATMAVEAWQDIWRFLPPVVGNLPR
jgi:hypothetical protein